MPLTDLEKDLLQSLLNNEPLLKVIHKVFNEVVECNYPRVREGDSNELLGAQYRAYELSKQILLSGFRQLETYKKGRSPESKINRAR